MYLSTQLHILVQPRISWNTCMMLGWGLQGVLKGTLDEWYDEQFRLSRSVDPSIPWEKIDYELWLMFMQSQSQPRPYTSPIAFSHNKCFNYNFKGSCDRPACQYTHKCIKCSEGHPQLSCPLNPPPLASNQINISTRGAEFSRPDSKEICQHDLQLQINILLEASLSRNRKSSYETVEII